MHTNYLLNLCTSIDLADSSSSEQHLLESGDPPLLGNDTEADNDVDVANKIDDKKFKNMYILRDLYKDINVDSLSFVLNPSIAEISQVTAMKMMNKFEESTMSITQVGFNE
jgi:hypothetical protein